MRTPVKLLALELFDKNLSALQQAGTALRQQAPREGWVRGIRTSLGMSMRSFAQRIGFKEPASVKEMERNERAGTVTLQTLRRAADALDADLVYAIIPRKPLREMVADRAKEVARQRVSPLAKSMALEEQGLTKAQLERQVEELARELEQKPEILWR
jgi:predicted DNA-binding mobile mystery protein A